MREINNLMYKKMTQCGINISYSIGNEKRDGVFSAVRLIDNKVLINIPLLFYRNIYLQHNEDSFIFNLSELIKSANQSVVSKYIDNKLTVNAVTSFFKKEYSKERFIVLRCISTVETPSVYHCFVVSKNKKLHRINYFKAEHTGEEITGLHIVGQLNIQNNYYNKFISFIDRTIDSVCKMSLNIE